MLWFYRRDEDLITVETRFDEATSEYVLIMQTADHDQTIERFKDLRAFQDRLVRAEEQRDFARRYKIRQVLDYGMIGAELLEVSLVKLAPPVRVVAKPNPEAGARGDVLQPHVDAGMLLREPRDQIRSTSILVPSEASGSS